MTLDLTSIDWVLLIGHCLGAAGFTICGIIAQDLASFIVTSLSYVTAVAFYFLFQFIIFQEISSGYGMYIEISGAVLTVISPSLVPLYEIFVQK